MLILLKIVVTIIILFVGLAIVGLVQTAIGGGALPLMIMGLAMIAGITAVWKYKPKPK